MGWINKLYETYDNAIDMVGVPQGEKNLTLLPIAHSTQNAQVEVTIDMDGNFQKAIKLEKDQAETIIPVTEDSACRSSGIAPHPLCDKLIYVAGDYMQYLPPKDCSKNVRDYFEAYIHQLKGWAESPYATDKVKAIYKYLSKERLMNDLIRKDILVLDGLFLDDKVKINLINQTDLFVRFSVESPNSDVIEEVESACVGRDKKLYDSYINYYLSTFQSTDLCYATGKNEYCSGKHSCKIRNSADKAKLISSNDAQGFTFRGRFTTDSEAYSVSYEVSQKAHNALKWLVQKQGIFFSDMVLVVWGTRNNKVPSPLGDSRSLFYQLDEDDQEEDELSIPSSPSLVDINDTEQVYASKLKKAIWSSKAGILDSDNIVIMMLDAATIGRLSIGYYKEMDGAKYKSQLLNWHETCTFVHHYRHFMGAPGVYDIIACAYGDEQGGKLAIKDNVKKTEVPRLIPCILEGRKIPLDIVKELMFKASKPLCYSQSNRDKINTVACAVIRKYYNDRNEKEVWKMALQEERTDRDYLYGRLLAVAQTVEARALYKKQSSEDKSEQGNDKARNTNAERLMNAFQSHPYTTWLTIMKKINPYQKMLKSSYDYYQRELEIIYSLFQVKDGKSEYESNKALSPLYLLGYNCQLMKYRTSKKGNEEEEENE